MAIQPIVFNWRQNGTSTVFASWSTTDTTSGSSWWKCPGGLRNFISG